MPPVEDFSNERLDEALRRSAGVWSEGLIASDPILHDPPTNVAPNPTPLSDLLNEEVRLDTTRATTFEQQMALWRRYQERFGLSPAARPGVRSHSSHRGVRTYSVIHDEAWEATNDDWTPEPMASESNSQTPTGGQMPDANAAVRLPDHQFAMVLQPENDGFNPYILINGSWYMISAGSQPRLTRADTRDVEYYLNPATSGRMGQTVVAYHGTRHSSTALENVGF